MTLSALSSSASPFIPRAHDSHFTTLTCENSLQFENALYKLAYKENDHGYAFVINNYSKFNIKNDYFIFLVPHLNHKILKSSDTAISYSFELVSRTIIHDPSHVIFRITEFLDKYQCWATPKCIPLLKALANNIENWKCLKKFPEEVVNLNLKHKESIIRAKERIDKLLGQIAHSQLNNSTLETQKTMERIDRYNSKMVDELDGFMLSTFEKTQIERAEMRKSAAQHIQTLKTETAPTTNNTSTTPSETVLDKKNENPKDNFLNFKLNNQGSKQ